MEYMTLEIWIRIRAQVVSIREDEHDFSVVFQLIWKGGVTFLDDKQEKGSYW